MQSCCEVLTGARTLQKARLQYRTNISDVRRNLT